MSQALRLPFDQYQRYRLVTDILDRVRRKGRSLRVLDVGGRTGLLRMFLKNDQVTLVDVEPGDISDGFVLGNGSALPFRDDAFDVVCAFDTLEHVPKSDRTAFVTECARVAGSYTILAGPYDSPEVKHAEVLLRRFLKEKLGIQHRYLEEHRQNGLPKRNVIEGQLEQQGAQVVSVGHANLERWFGLMCLEFYLDDDPSLRKMAESIYEFYNRSLYASDHRAPVYRHAVVAAMGKATLPDLSILFPDSAAPAGALASFNEMLKSLVAFDRERENWREERASFQQALQDLGSDLDGHRGTLQESKSDVDGHRKTIEVLQADLEQHGKTIEALRAREKELDQERKQVDELRHLAERKAAEFEAQSSYFSERHDEEHLIREGLEEDLRQHLMVVRDLRKELKETKASFATVTDDRDQHHVALAEARQGLAELQAHAAEITERRDEALAHAKALNDELVEHRKVAAAHSSEKQRLGDDRDKLRVQLGEVRGELDRVQALLADERQQAQDLATKLRGEIAGHAEQARTLQKEIEGLRGAHGEAARELDKYQVGTADIESEMKKLRAEAQRIEVKRHEAATERDKARERIARLEELLNQREAASANAGSQEEEWNAERASFNHAMSEVLRELDDAREMLAKMTEQRDEAMATLPMLEQDLDGHRRVLARVQAQRDAARTEAEAWEAEREQLRRHIEELESQLPSLRSSPPPRED